ncbi:MAG: hypothetical protein IPL61_39185 [Myxococcales bacterium]|nr:hypothetical protein [Myxococcales bacterium]
MRCVGEELGPEAQRARARTGEELGPEAQRAQARTGVAPAERAGWSELVAEARVADVEAALSPCSPRP